MSETVRHIQGLDDRQKTMCGRTRSHNIYTMTLETYQARQLPSYERLCSRCRSRMEREGLILPEGMNADGTVDHEAISSGDKQHDKWLSRLGVC